MLQIMAMEAFASLASQVVHRSTTEVEPVLNLFAAGWTALGISRSQPELVGDWDEGLLQALEQAAQSWRLIEDRRHAIQKTLQAQGKATPELTMAVAAASSMRELEDVYFPYRPAKESLAEQARERTLTPLADEIQSAAPSCQNLDARAADFVNTDRGVVSAADALLGAGQILSERFAAMAEIRRKLREDYRERVQLSCTAGTAPAEKTHAFRSWVDRKVPANTVAAHDLVLVLRGERQKALVLTFEYDPTPARALLEPIVAPSDHPHREMLLGCAASALEKLLFPAFEKELRSELIEQAQAASLQVQCRTLRRSLLQAPLRNVKPLAVFPSKKGVALAALDAEGKLMDQRLVPGKDPAEAGAALRAAIVELARQHATQVIALAQGAGFRVWEQEVAAAIAELQSGEPSLDLTYVLVPDAGAWSHAERATGRDAVPGVDAPIRAAVSIGARLLDPLAEFTKLEPASLGTGPSVHDIPEPKLRAAFEAEVSRAVNLVGLDLNLATTAELAHVYGLNPLLARRITDYRTEKGPFQQREQLLQVLGVTADVYLKAAGFIRVTGDYPLDRMPIHPRHYELATGIIRKLGGQPSDLLADRLPDTLFKGLSEADHVALSKELDAPSGTIKTLLISLLQGAGDIRTKYLHVLKRKAPPGVADLKPGLELPGAVIRVENYGAFVDVGVKLLGLAHVSRMSERRVDNAHQVIGVGEQVRVRVVEYDAEKKQLSLAMVLPKVRIPRPPRKDAPSKPAAAGTKFPRPKDNRGNRRPQGARSGRPGGPKPEGTTGGTATVAGSAAGTAAATGSGSPPPRVPYKPAKPKKPLSPLAQSKVQGKEPLRSFGELKQLIELRTPPPPEQGT